LYAKEIWFMCKGTYERARARVGERERRREREIKGGYESRVSHVTGPGVERKRQGGGEVAEGGGSEKGRGGWVWGGAYMRHSCSPQRPADLEFFSFRLSDMG